MRILTQRAEHELEQRRGELVELSAVRAEYAELATMVKARLRAIPDAIAVQVVGAASAGAAAVRKLELARGADRYDKPAPRAT